MRRQVLVGMLWLLSGCGAREPSSGVQRQALLGTPYRVKDIDPSPNPAFDSFPSLARIGGVNYLAAGDASGHELWRTDGTPEGTVLLLDLGAGLNGSPRNFVDFNGTAVFSADSGTSGQFLWKSDGTTAGTVPIWTEQGRQVHSIHAAGSTLFFTTVLDAYTIEIRTLDATLTSATLLHSFEYSTSQKTEYTAVGNRLFFSAKEGAIPLLWTSDGTIAGTVEISTFFDEPRRLTAVGSTLFFTTFNGSQLWKSDGTDGGTVLLKTITTRVLLEAAGTLYFFGDDGTNGLELWKSNGTDVGTVMVKNIGAAGASGVSNSTLPFAVGSTVYFEADDGSTGLALWKSNGSDVGTVLVQDLRPGDTASPMVRFIAAIGSTAYFRANDPSELWKTAGTGPTTQLVSAAASFGPGISTGTELLLNATTAQNGAELWKSDGTTAALLKDIYSSGSSNPQLLTDLDGKLIFTARNPIDLDQLWISDGSEAETKLLKDLNPTQFALAKNFTRLGDLLLFSACDGAIDRPKLWKTNGTPQGTVVLQDINPTGNANLNSFFAWNGAVYFSASDANGAELWKSDGTSAVLVSDINDDGPSSNPSQFTPLGDRLYFWATRMGNRQLWRTDGTTMNTEPVTNLLLQSYDELTAAGGKLYFRADDGVGGLEPWVSDGTEAGTLPLGDLQPGAIGSYPSHFVTLGNLVYFEANSAPGEREIYRSNGTAAGTVRAVDLPPAPLDDDGESPTLRLVATQSQLYFFATLPATGRELYRFDGTNLQLVGDLWPGAPSTDYDLAVFPIPGSKLVVFAASDGTHGHELWMSNGTSATRLSDINPGPGSSSPAALAISGTRLYFNADDGSGSELWAMELAGLDDAPPVLTCPDVLLDAVDASGAPASYPGLVISDDASLPASTVSPAPDTLLPIGTTQVTVTATDWLGKSANCTFNVVVQDAPPILSCPPDQQVDAAGPVAYPAATATDAVSTPTVSYSQASGSAFPVGETTVTVTATDSAGNTTQCSFKITVSGPDGGASADLAVAPDLSSPIPVMPTGPDGCSCQLGARADFSTTAVWLVLGLLGLPRRRREQR